MKTILSEMHNDVELKSLKKSEIKTLLREIKLELLDSFEMLQLPLTEDEQGAYLNIGRYCREDIKTIQTFLETNK